MIYILFFFILIFFSDIHGICLIFPNQRTEIYMNNCALIRSDAEGYKQCLRCHLRRTVPLSNVIILDRNCSPIPDNHCVDLHFNTTVLFKNFFQQYSDLINKLFVDQDNKHIGIPNTLYIHIEYDTLDVFSFDTFRSLDQIKNRKYHVVSFELKNRENQLTLPLNHDINNMTLLTLQINIYCGLQGLYQYHYISDHRRQPLADSLKCEIPTTTMVLLTTTSTRKNRSRVIIMFTLIGSGSLIPCLILACCLFILCKRNHETNHQRRESFASSIDDSILSDQT
jgi:hypothetical protein